MKKKFLTNLDEFMAISSQEASQLIGGAGSEGVWIPPHISPTPPQHDFNADLEWNKPKKPFPDYGSLPGMPDLGSGATPPQGGMGGFPSTDSRFGNVPIPPQILTPTPSTSFSGSISTSGVTIGATQDFGNVSIGASLSVGTDGKISESITVTIRF